MIILNYIKSNSKMKISEVICKYSDIDSYQMNLKCPYCNSSDTIKWGSYNRNIYYLDNNIYTVNTINIKRIKCKICGKTHALIPSCIVPYKQNTLDVILSVISNTNSSLNLDISFDTFNKWNKQFNKFLPYLKTMFNNDNKLNIINRILNDINNIYYRIYYFTKLILMLNHKAIYTMAHF